MNELSKIYQRRFEEDLTFRKEMHKVLCDDFFSRYIPEDSAVLDLAAGYCEFINSVKARKKIAVDLNPDMEKYAGDDVETIVSSSECIEHVGDESVDVIFVSNFFEHIEKDAIVKTLNEALRVLKKGGKLLILQPNIRYCYKDYWMFFDHITPLDDRSLTEILEVRGFKVAEVKPKFLPYTLKSRLPKSLLLLKVYLKVPLLQYLFGKQAFICAHKS